MPFPIKRLQQWWKCWFLTSSASSEYHGSYTVTKAITQVPSHAEGFATPRSEQDILHTHPSAVQQHGGTTHQTVEKHL
jgi:hypothetical protein